MAVPKRVTARKIAKKLARKTRMSELDLTFLFQLYCEEMKKALLEGEPVYIEGVGTISTGYKNQPSRNYDTGVVTIMANYPYIRFKMSVKMRSAYRKALVGRWRRENPMVK